MSLHIQGLTARHRHGPEVVHGVDLQAPAGQITALLGPNGAGKSTLLKAVVGLVPSAGSVRLDGVELSTLEPRERARRLAYVPQRSQLMARLTVKSVVEMGRFAWRGPLSRLSSEDRTAVSSALAAVGATDLASRPFPALSGGEQQRVLLARALATGAQALVLDEPTAALDVQQVLVLHAVLRRLADQGRTVLVVLHDLNETLQHADRAVLMDAGRVHAAGPVQDIVQAEPIRQVYGVDLREGGLRFQLPEAP